MSIIQKLVLFKTMRFECLLKEEDIAIERSLSYWIIIHFIKISWTSLDFPFLQYIQISLILVNRLHPLNNNLVFLNHQLIILQFTHTVHSGRPFLHVKSRCYNPGPTWIGREGRILKALDSRVGPDIAFQLLRLGDPENSILVLVWAWGCIACHLE